MTTVTRSLVPFLSHAPSCEEAEVCLSPTAEQLVSEISAMMKSKLMGYVTDPPDMAELHASMRRTVAGVLKRGPSDQELDNLAVLCSLPFMSLGDRLDVNPRALLEDVTLIYLRDFQEATSIGWLSSLVSYEVLRRLGYIEEWEWRWDPSGESGVTLVTVKRPMTFQRIELSVDTSFIYASPET